MKAWILILTLLTAASFTAGGTAKTKTRPEAMLPSAVCDDRVREAARRRVPSGQMGIPYHFPNSNTVRVEVQVFLTTNQVDVTIDASCNVQATSLTIIGNSRTIPSPIF
jgi:hypothetical protein